MIKAMTTWKEKHAGAHVGLMVVTEVVNPRFDPRLEADKRKIETELRKRFKARAEIASTPVFQAYHNYYRRFAKTYPVQQQVESISLKNKPLPQGAGLVEAMFMAEVKNGLLTAGHDYASLKQPLELDCATEQESYLLINGKEQRTQPEDMLMRDATGVISSIMYGPDFRTRIVAETTQALFVVYAPVGIAPELIIQHFEDILAYIRLFAPQAKSHFQTVLDSSSNP